MFSGSPSVSPRVTRPEPAVIARELMDGHPFAWLPMLSRVLASAELLPDAAVLHLRVVLQGAPR